MNKTKTSIAEDLRQIVGPTNVLVDIEDLYVYSYEHFFRKRQYPELNLVVRVNSNEQAQQVMELARKQNFRVIRRSTGKEVLGSARSPVVLLDDVISPKLKILSMAEEKERIAEYVEEIYRGVMARLETLP